jgi:hypothetical protein
MTRYLTKKERRLIYEKAANNLQESISGYGMCYHLTMIFNRKRINGYHINNFPELKLFKPRVVDCYWLPTTDRDTRIIILLLCAEMTK